MVKESKKNKKINPKVSIIISLILFLLAFYNSYHYIVPNNIHANINKFFGKIYDENKDLGIYTIRVKAIEKTNIFSNQGIFYIIEHDNGVSMLESSYSDKYVEKVYKNKDKLKEEEYLLSVKSLPRYSKGRYGKITNITLQLEEDFENVYSEKISIFSHNQKSNNSVSTTQYLSTIELRSVSYFNIFLIGILYGLSIYFFYRTIRELSRRKLESEGIWEEI